MKINKSFVGAALAAGIAGVFLTSTSAQAVDEWSDPFTGVIPFTDNCRIVSSSAPGAKADFTICWDNDYDPVYLQASVSDTAADGYHAEARIRYKIYDDRSFTWSDYHYRAALTDLAPDGVRVGPYNFKATLKTGSVAVAACVYNGSTLINCDDRGWR